MGEIVFHFLQTIIFTIYFWQGNKYSLKSRSCDVHNIIKKKNDQSTSDVFVSLINFKTINISHIIISLLSIN